MLLTLFPRAINFANRSNVQVHRNQFYEMIARCAEEGHKRLNFQWNKFHSFLVTKFVKFTSIEKEHPTVYS